MTPAERPPAAPAVSIVIPAYESHDTIGRCLDALRAQRWTDFEVVVVDSSPSDRTAAFVPKAFPEVRYVRSARRLLPHAARNHGVALTSAPLIVFLDPDIYAAPECLGALVDTHSRTGGVVVGALACYGNRWRDRGLHLCKFGAWLPAGRLRPTHMAPTACMLIGRQDFERAGGLPDGDMLGDIGLSRQLQALGRVLFLQPEAVVEHHHEQDVRGLVRERYARGQMYGELRLGWLAERPVALTLLILSTLIPVRLPRIMAIGMWQAVRARQGGTFFGTLPLIALGHSAAIAGEAVAYARHYLRVPVARPAMR